MSTTVTTTGPHAELVTGAKLAHVHGVVYPLTLCCGASSKGAGTDIVCRKCYAKLPETLGMAWQAADFVTEYPAWCTAHGLTEGTPGVFGTYARIVARELGIAK